MSVRSHSRKTKFTNQVITVTFTLFSLLKNKKLFKPYQNLTYQNLTMARRRPRRRNRSPPSFIGGRGQAGQRLLSGRPPPRPIHGRPSLPGRGRELSPPARTAIRPISRIGEGGQSTGGGGGGGVSDVPAPDPAPATPTPPPSSAQSVVRQS